MDIVNANKLQAAGTFTPSLNQRNFKKPNPTINTRTLVTTFGKNSHLTKYSQQKGHDIDFDNVTIGRVVLDRGQQRNQQTL